MGIRNIKDPGGGDKNCLGMYDNFFIDVLMKTGITQ